MDRSPDYYTRWDPTDTHEPCAENKTDRINHSVDEQTLLDG